MCDIAPTTLNETTNDGWESMVTAVGENSLERPGVRSSSTLSAESLESTTGPDADMTSSVGGAENGGEEDDDDDWGGVTDFIASHTYCSRKCVDANRWTLIDANLLTLVQQAPCTNDWKDDMFPIIANWFQKDVEEVYDAWARGVFSFFSLHSRNHGDLVRPESEGDRFRITEEYLSLWRQCSRRKLASKRNNDEETCEKMKEDMEKIEKVLDRLRDHTREHYKLAVMWVGVLFCMPVLTEENREDVIMEVGENLLDHALWYCMIHMWSDDGPDTMEINELCFLLARKKTTKATKAKKSKSSEAFREIYAKKLECSNLIHLELAWHPEIYRGIERTMNEINVVLGDFSTGGVSVGISGGTKRKFCQEPMESIEQNFVFHEGRLKRIGG